jgi:hypothetical protein
MMNITLPFSVNEDITIDPLDDHPGTIVEIRITDGQPVYVVEYWWEGKIQVVNLTEKDITKKERYEKRS